MACIGIGLIAYIWSFHIDVFASLFEIVFKFLRLKIPSTFQILRNANALIFSSMIAFWVAATTCLQGLFFFQELFGMQAEGGLSSAFSKQFAIETSQRIVKGEIP